MTNEDKQFDPKSHPRILRGRYIFAVLAISVLLGVTYGNSLYGEWHFDDYPNIVENAGIHLNEFSWHGIKQSFLFQERFSRPLSYLSFALNYRFGGLDVFGYHLVNLAIHLVTALFLFLFTFHTLRLPVHDKVTVQSAFPAALLATALWAVSPVQVLAVSYVVQRMTSLGGMFFIMAMFFYLKGRTSASLLQKRLSYGLFAVSALAAFGSKENTSVLPAVIFVYDLFLIQGVTRDNVRKSLKFAVISIVAVIILGVFYTDYSALAFGFTQRGFTAGERLLTEGRVMLFYLSLLIYPMGERLALLHDIEVSRSLIHPWTTAPALLLIFLSIAYALWNAKKRPLISFCIIAFFLNHGIEGSVIPLELIYEHRNYIPSMFFFIALAFSIVRMLTRFSYRKSLLYLMAAVVVCFLVVEGYTVSRRNEILKFEKTLWLDNVTKAPNLSRTHSNLGKVFLQEGNYDAALYEFNEALRIGRYGNLTQPAFDLCCLGNYYLAMEDDADKAIAFYEEAIRRYGVIPEIYDGMAVAMLQKGNLQRARENSREAVFLKKDRASYHNNLALILLKERDLAGAEEEANKALLLDVAYTPPLTILGEVYRLRGDYRNSARYWERYLTREERDINAWFALVEAYAKLDDKPRTVQAVSRLLCRAGSKDTGDIIGFMNRRGNLLAYVPKRETLETIIRMYGPDGRLTKASTCR